jgi:hypothetical protein
VPVRAAPCSARTRSRGRAVPAMTPFRRPRRARPGWAGLEFALAPVARPNPVVAAWRWRYELGLAVGLPIAVIALVSAGEVRAVLWVSVLCGVISASPAVRRLVIARAWCVITPHRVRTACAQSWVHSRGGKIPIVLLTTRGSFGERTYLWCRAGTSPEDLVWARSRLAAACWAADIEIARHEHYAQLVRLDVVRRPGGYTVDGDRDYRWLRLTVLPAAPSPAGGNGYLAPEGPAALPPDPATGDDQPGHAA